MLLLYIYILLFLSVIFISHYSLYFISLYLLCVNNSFIFLYMYITVFIYCMLIIVVNIAYKLLFYLLTIWNIHIIVFLFKQWNKNEFITRNPVTIYIITIFHFVDISPLLTSVPLLLEIYLLSTLSFVNIYICMFQNYMLDIECFSIK